MKKAVEVIARLIEAGKRTYARKWSFLALFGIFFLGSVILLGKADLLPQQPVRLSAGETPLIEHPRDTVATPAIETPELPVRIEIPDIDLLADIANPESADIRTLDAALLSGAVRYPASARLGEEGNVVVFGHSSYLPVVLNPAFKTFNDIQKLSAGDLIIVSSSDKAYTYRVRTVTKENAEDAGIPLSVEGRVLTLSTCDSFGAKTDRFVVTADFVESHPLGA